MARPAAVSEDPFDQIEQVLRSGGPAAAFAFLAKKAREEKNYPLLFEVRLMQKRRELGLPLILTEPLRDLPKAKDSAYQEASVDAAREVGSLFLTDGAIDRAWPYFRAIGEVGPVKRAIEKMPTKDAPEEVLQIAYYEGVAPQRGFEAILDQQGICRAITCFGQYPGHEGREESAQLLARRLHQEIVRNLKSEIARRDEKAPESNSIPEIVAERDWLFEGGACYTDSSHVSSIVQLSTSLSDPETLRVILELTEYGRRLAPMFQYAGQSPFENVYEDHAAYIKTLLEMDVEAGIEHFRRKAQQADSQDAYDHPAQALVVLLTRLKRYDEAIEVSQQYLADIEPRLLKCAPLTHLCEMAGDTQRLVQVARERGDLLAFTAAALET